MGSLSYRFNVGPLHKDANSKKDSESSNTSRNDDMDVDKVDEDRKDKEKENSDLRRKLKQAEESKKMILVVKKNMLQIWEKRISLKR